MPDGAVLLADRWFPTPGFGWPADRVDPHAVRAAHHRPARTAVRRARLPGRDPELPGDVRVRGRVGSRPPRAGRRPCHARVGGGAAVVRRPPRHVGRELPRHDAVGDRAGRAGLRQGARPPGHRVELPRRHRVPGRLLRARDGADLAPPDRAPGARLARRAARPAAGRPGARRPPPTCCPSGSATWRPSGGRRPPTRTGSSTAPPGTRGGTAIDFGRRLEKVPPASLIGGWYDLFLPAQVADYEALRARRPPGPPHHRARGPTPAPACSPRRSATAPSGSTSSSVSGPATSRGRPCASSSWGRAPGRSSPCGRRRGRRSGGTSGAGARSTRRHRPRAAPDRYHYNPHDPTPAVGGPSLNIVTAGRKDQRRREHRHDVLTYTSPVLTEDLTVIGPLTATLYLRSSLEHTDFFVRLCDVSEKGRSVNLSDGIVRLVPGSVHKEDDGVFKLDDRHVADGQHVPGRPPDPPPGLERRPPAVLPQPRHAASRWPRAPPCARPTRRSSTTPPARRPSRCPSCGCCRRPLETADGLGPLG